MGLTPYRATFKCSDNFLRNHHGATIIYTDGASTFNGKRNYNGDKIGSSACGVYITKDITFSFKNPSMTSLPNGEGNTNQFAEAHAIEKALEWAEEKKLSKIEIRKII